MGWVFLTRGEEDSRQLEELLLLDSGSETGWKEGDGEGWEGSEGRDGEGEIGSELDDELGEVGWAVGDKRGIAAG